MLSYSYASKFRVVEHAIASYQTATITIPFVTTKTEQCIAKKYNLPLFNTLKCIIGLGSSLPPADLINSQ